MNTKLKLVNNYWEGIEDEQTMEELNLQQKREKLIEDLIFQVDCHQNEINKLEKAIEQLYENARYWRL